MIQNPFFETVFRFFRLFFKIFPIYLKRVLNIIFLHNPFGYLINEYPACNYSKQHFSMIGR